MNLCIVRHAIAVQRGTPGYDDDSQHPLTDNGRKKMKKVDTSKSIWAQQT